MSDVPDAEITVIPAQLMGTMPLSITTPNGYSVVKNAVDRFNTATGGDVDPISIAEALVKKGYNIAFIPERKVEIQPTQDGLILDTKQILQVLSDDRLAEFPILDMAIDTVAYVALAGNGNLRSAMEEIGKVRRQSFARDETEAQDSRTVAKDFLLSQAMLHLRYGDKPVSQEESEKIAPLIVEQALFILDNIENVDQLRTKEQQRRYERRHEIAKEEDRRARQSRREELFASSEAAERWLFGVARGALRDAKENVEDAAQGLSQSKRAPELIAHHAIDLFDFTDRQIAALEERERRKEMWRIEGPIAVLLTAFAKPRAVDSSPPTIRKGPGDHMYQLVLLWLDAKFVSELPNGAYADVLRSEHEYQKRYRDREHDSMRRESFFGYGQDDTGFYDRIAREETAGDDREMRGYESSRVAMLWWKCPVWLQWKILRPYIGEEFRKVRTLVRDFSAKDFLTHIDDLIARENRVIKLQNLVLGTLETGDKDTLERYWKEIMETGAPSILSRLEALAHMERTPAQDRADTVIQACRARIKDLDEMRDYVNLDFVMSREDREAEIERRQKERARWQIPRFRW